jgi:hypothetical protein
VVKAIRETLLYFDTHHDEVFARADVTMSDGEREE